jgi:hypothetical protein
MEDTLRRLIVQLGEVAAISVLIELSLPALKRRIDAGDAIQPAWGEFLDRLVQRWTARSCARAPLRDDGPLAILVVLAGAKTSWRVKRWMLGKMNAGSRRDPPSHAHDAARGDAPGAARLREPSVGVFEHGPGTIDEGEHLSPTRSSSARYAASSSSSRRASFGCISRSPSETVTFLRRSSSNAKAMTTSGSSCAASSASSGRSRSSAISPRK